MKTKFLISNQFKTYGWIIFLIALAAGVLQFFGGFEPNWLNWKVPALLYSDWNLNGEKAHWSIITMVENNVADEVCASLLLIGGLLLVFAREKDEDEMIMKIRLESMLWSARFNGFFLLVCVLFIYDITFFYVMVFNLFLLFVLFIIRFHLVLRNFRMDTE